MIKISVRLVALALLGTLGGCSAQSPYREVEFCFGHISDLDEMMAVLRGVANAHNLKFTDGSTSVRNDLKTLDSPLANQPIAWALVEDDRWFSDSGSVMINNVGATSPRNVHMSFFHNHSLFGSDSKTQAVADDLVSAIKEKWALSDSTDRATKCGN